MTGSVPCPERPSSLSRGAQLQFFAHHWGIDDIHLEGHSDAVFRYNNPHKMGQLAKRCRGVYGSSTA